MAVIKVSATGGASTGTTTYSPETLPTESDDVLLDASSGNFNIQGTLTCRSIEATAEYAKKITVAAGTVIKLGKPTEPKTDRWIMRLPAGVLTTPPSAATVEVSTAAATTASKWATSTNSWGAATITFTKGIVKLEETLTTGVTGNVGLTGGELDTGGLEHSWGGFSSTGATARNIVATTSTFKLTGTGTVWAVSGSGYTIAFEKAVIEITDAGKVAKTFTAGATATYATIIVAGGAETSLKIGISLTCKVLRCTGQMKFIITKGITISVSEALWMKGESGKLIAWESNEAGKAFNLIIGGESSGPGTQTVNFCSFKDCTYSATTRTKLYATNSTNVSGNANINFEGAPHALTTVGQTSSATVTPPGALLGGSLSIFTHPSASVAEEEEGGRFQCVKTGKAAKIHLRTTGEANTCTSGYLFLCADVAGKPGEVIAQGKFTGTPTQNTGLEVKLEAQVELIVGTFYWVMMLPLGGTLHFLYSVASGGSSVGFDATDKYATPTTPAHWTNESLGPISAWVEEALGAEVKHTLTVSNGQASIAQKEVSRRLTMTQGQARTLVRALARAVSATNGQSARVSRTEPRTFSLTGGQAATLTRGLERPLAATGGQSVTLSHPSLTRTLAASASQSATQTGALARRLTVTQGQARVLLKALPKTLSTTQPQSASVAALTGGLVKNITLSAKQAQAGALARALGRTATASQAHSTTLAHSLTRTLVAPQGQSAARQRALTRTLLVSQAQSATCTATRSLTVTLGVGQGQSALLGGAHAQPRLLFAQASSTATLAAVVVEAVYLPPFDMTPGSGPATEVVSSGTAETSVETTTTISLDVGVVSPAASIVSGVESPQTEAGVI